MDLFSIYEYSIYEAQSKLNPLPNMDNIMKDIFGYEN